MMAALLLFLKRPPSGLPAISPSRGEIGCGDAGHN